jgi:hypothetical protein
MGDEFLNEVVRPNVAELHAHPASLRYAYNAIADREHQVLPLVGSGCIHRDHPIYASRTSRDTRLRLIDLAPAT